jgi:hypothetical protein
VIRADWERLDRALAPIAVPIYRVPGNHDICDVATRDVWIERYGSLPRALEFGNARFLLVSSAWIPEDDDPRKHPQSFIRGRALGASDQSFLRAELESHAAQHVFVVMHHMLWWEDTAPWWRDVHPLFAGRNVRAVFAGDYGPMKFSHLSRDGVEYLQTSIENKVSLEMLRGREASRALSSQFDNFLFVTVDGSEVRYEVRTVGALNTGKFTPQHWREVYEYDKDSLSRRIYARWSTPDRLIGGLLGVSGAAFALGAGVVVAFVLARRIARRRA